MLFDICCSYTDAVVIVALVVVVVVASIVILIVISIIIAVGDFTVFATFCLVAL